MCSTYVTGDFYNFVLLKMTVHCRYMSPPKTNPWLPCRGGGNTYWLLTGSRSPKPRCEASCQRLHGNSSAINNPLVPDSTAMWVVTVTEKTLKKSLSEAGMLWYRSTWSAEGQPVWCTSPGSWYSQHTKVC
jgi:hypothetical protein